MLRTTRALLPTGARWTASTMKPHTLATPLLSRYMRTTAGVSSTPTTTEAGPAAQPTAAPAADSPPAANTNQSNSGGGNRRAWTRMLGIGFFLGTSAFAFYLGTWQVKRKAWKQDLIARRSAALEAPPLDLLTYLRSRPSSAAAASSSNAAPVGSSLAPSSTSTSDPLDIALEDECRRMTAKGHFLYDRTLLLGPRNPPSPDATSTAGQGIGYFLLTPMRMEDGTMVLVNRGWCPKEKCTQGSKEHYEVQDADKPVEIVGVLRKGEAEPQFLPDSYDPLKSESFVWLDLPRIAELTGVTSSSSSPSSSSPVLLDALEVKPSTNRAMRRRTFGDYLVFTTTPEIHTVYAATWFTLSAALVGLTYIRFKKKLRIQPLKSASSKSRVQK